MFAVVLKMHINKHTIKLVGPQLNIMKYTSTLNIPNCILLNSKLFYVTFKIKQPLITPKITRIIASSVLVPIIKNHTHCTKMLMLKLSISYA